MQNAYKVDCVYPACDPSAVNAGSAGAQSSVRSDYPNLMPTSLEAIYQMITEMRKVLNAMEKAVKDGSAGVRPPSYNPESNDGFPVPIPFNPNVY